MNKLRETTTPTTTETTQAEQTIETVETVALEDVTGGCARCGCGVGGTGASQQLAANWPR